MGGMGLKGKLGGLGGALGGPKKLIKKPLDKDVGDAKKPMDEKKQKVPENESEQNTKPNESGEDEEKKESPKKAIVSKPSFGAKAKAKGKEKSEENNS